MFQVIDLEVEIDNWKAIQLSRGGPKISHLAFADDLLLFAEANLEQAELINQALLNFCMSSGQKVSHEKTRVYFSNNVSRFQQEDICNVLGFHSTTDLGKYLGVPIFHQRIGLNTFNFVIDKVKQRLSAWKARTLSFAGRVTLAKSIIQAMPTYVMQSSVLPKTTCDDIDKLCRGFIWGDDDQSRKVHLIKWDKLCKSKKEGGLGLRNTRMANTALLMKSIWNFCNQPDSLWSKVIRSKYKCGSYNFPKIDIKRKGSNFWNGLGNIWTDFREKLSWQIGNGDSVRFWTDIWLEGTDALASYCTNNLMGDVANKPISHFISYEGNWRTSEFENLLPDTILQIINNTIPPNITSQDDSFTWGVTPDGNFSTKSAYVAIQGDQNTTTATIFNTIWNWKGTERVRTFLWKLGHGTLLTNAERKRRHMTTSGMCTLCNEKDETLFHCFRDCKKVINIWRTYNLNKNGNFFNIHNWETWLEENLRRNVKINSDPNWHLKFGIVLDNIWRNRNDWIFSQKYTSIQSSIITIQVQLDGILEWVKRTELLKEKNDYLPQNSIDHWISPPKGRWKLNSDGSVKNCGRLAACGGILRDCNGKMIFAFSHRVDACSVTEAELWGVYHGVSLAWGRGFKELDVEIDSMDALELLRNEGRGGDASCGRLVQSILEIGKHSINCNWSWVDREVNMAAHKLAHNSYEIRDMCVIFNLVPDFLVQTVTADSIGLRAHL